MASTSTNASGSTNTPCAACKAQRRKCTSDCVFAPYFPPDNPHKFNCVHKVFGASNVSKILLELSPENREDAVNSMAYEAEARLRDPVYGCVGLISILQQRLRQLQSDLNSARSDLSHYIGPSAAMLPIFPPLPPSFAPRPGQPLPPLPPINRRGVLVPPPPPPPPPPQRSYSDDQYAAALAREQEEMLRVGLEQRKLHQAHALMMRSSSSSSSSSSRAMALVNNSTDHNNNGFVDRNINVGCDQIFESTDLALGSFGDATSYHMNQQAQEFQHQIHQQQFMLQTQPQPQHEYQLRLGFLRNKLDDEDKCTTLGNTNIIINNNNNGPSY